MNIKTTISYIIGAFVGVGITYVFAPWILSQGTEGDPMSMVYVFLTFIVATGIAIGLISILVDRWGK